ncbi:phosphoglucosamine mutase [bacterium Unc6]|nr:phosphoglucosamine mutase [bacterium Unc6]
MKNIPIIFNTDGLRAEYNKWPLDKHTVKNIGFFLSRLLDAKSIVLCRDGRCSGQSIFSDLCSGMTKYGTTVLDAGLLPTPAMSVLVKKMKADAGISISASHNPSEYNGIKIFSSDGIKIASKYEREIERLLFEDRTDITTSPVIEDAGKMCEDIYLDYLAGVARLPNGGVSDGLNVQDLKISVDCANGAASYIIEKFLKQIDASVMVYSNAPDGVNINKGCGSTCPENICNIVRTDKADIGVALDGDADRAIFCDAKGNIVDGDFVLAMLGLDMLKEGILSCNTVVGTVMSNLGLEIALKENGARLIRTAVGDKNVLDEMLKGNYVIGGEQSGHIIFLRCSTAGDGIVTLIQVLKFMNKTGKTLEDLSSCMKKFPQILLNAPVKNKVPLDKIELYKKALEDANRRLGKYGRIVVRYSGTEPLVRVMVEGDSDAKVKNVAQSLLDAVLDGLNLKKI